MRQRTIDKRPSLTLAAAALLGSAWFGLQSQAAKPVAGEQYVGTWTGTWDGSGSGKFELTLEQQDGTMHGGVAVGTDQGDYTAKFTALAFDGSKMTARYTYPPDEQGEVALTATFDGKSAEGTWSLGAKGGGGEMAAGGWHVTRK